MRSAATWCIFAAPALPPCAHKFPSEFRVAIPPRPTTGRTTCELLDRVEICARPSAVPLGWLLQIAGPNSPRDARKRPELLCQALESVVQRPPLWRYSCRCPCHCRRQALGAAQPRRAGLCHREVRSPRKRVRRQSPEAGGLPPLGVARLHGQHGQLCEGCHHKQRNDAASPRHCFRCHGCTTYGTAPLAPFCERCGPLHRTAPGPTQCPRCFARAPTLISLHHARQRVHSASLHTPAPSRSGTRPSSGAMPMRLRSSAQARRRPSASLRLWRYPENCSSRKSCKHLQTSALCPLACAEEMSARRAG